MAFSFAITTSIIVCLYALWSSYFVFDTMRGDMKDFMRHELEEFAGCLSHTDGTPDAIRGCMTSLLEITGKTPIAFRVRGEQEQTIVEDGNRRLLDVVNVPIKAEESWREYLFTRQIAVMAHRHDRHPITLEVIISARAYLDQIEKYLSAALLCFLISVGLATFAGWSTAYRGLHSLREVVAQARSIALPAANIELHNAPREVRDVGIALNGMLDRINSGLTDMRTFTAGLAHELRSPLMNLIGETEVTLLSPRSTDEYQQLLRSNLDDLVRLSDAVDNLVAYCHTAHPEQPLIRAEGFDLAREAELRLGRLFKSAQRDGIRLTFRSSGDTTIHADREGCLRVLRNLVDNAIVWTPQGGEVDVHVEGTPDAVRVSVRDSGPGVPADLGEKIFEPFVSARQRAGKRGSYGLGLAICRSVTDVHGGKLGFENLQGGGARFCAEFPRAGRSIAKA